MIGLVPACPRCHTRLPDSPLPTCPACGVRLDNLPTRRVRDLDATTVFRPELPSDETTADELVGTELSHYFIEQFLGQGGMARVYLGRHLTLERPCAVKVLKPALVQRDPDAVTTFLAEARAAANLVHPHVVTIHTIGADRGFHFIEMEYIEGDSLASLLASEGPLAAEAATGFLVQIGAALAVAHDQHLVHRDVKPGNVMVNADRLAKLADFGLAKRILDQHSDDGGWISGTPNYMAPELFLGQRADKRSDVYAMGVTYFLLLTGQLPANGDTITELMQWHQQNTAPDIRAVREDVPDIAAQVVQRCLARHPADRPADAIELHQELRAVFGSLRSLESLLHEALRGTGVAIQGGPSRFELTVRLPEGRKQHLVVEICEGLAAAEQVVRIFSICGVADEQHFRRALEINPHFPHGAIGLETIRGVPHFVMTNAFPRATCDADEIRRSVLDIAQRADEVERCLGTDDRH